MKKLAFTGMDALGSAMAIRLLHAGYQVTVYDKTQGYKEIFSSNSGEKTLHSYGVRILVKQN